MIKLDEKDIKAVAGSRFTRSHSKQLTAAFLCCLAAILGLVNLTDRFEFVPEYIAFAPVVGLSIYVVWYLRNINKAGKELVEEWKKGE